jgi:SOS-response transcriptional repressor LexA
MGAKMPAPENYPLPAEKYIQTDFCLRISGESMTPLLQNGDIVGIKAQCGADSGQLIAARYEEKLTLAQWLLRDEKWYLVPSNPLFTEIPIDPAVTNMAILGVVVWHIHDSSRH